MDKKFYSYIISCGIVISTRQSLQSEIDHRQVNTWAQRGVEVLQTPRLHLISIRGMGPPVYYVKKNCTQFCIPSTTRHWESFLENLVKSWISNPKISKSTICWSNFWELTLIISVIILVRSWVFLGKSDLDPNFEFKNKLIYTGSKIPSCIWYTQI